MSTTAPKKKKDPDKPASIHRQKETSNPKLLALVAVCSILLLAILIIIIRPELLHPRARSDSSAIDESTARAQEGVEESQFLEQRGHIVANNEGKIIAQQGLQKAVAQYAALQRDGAALWGRSKRVTSFPQVEELMDQANRQFDRAAYTEAADLYHSALSEMQKLEASKFMRIDQALATGREALAADDASAAQAAFEVALAGSPTLSEASEGLALAKRLPEALKLVKEAVLAESQGELESALSLCKKANEIIPSRQEWIEDENRIGLALKEQQFQNLITAAMTALDEGNFTQAKRAMDAASELEPRSPIIQDLQKRLSASAQKVALTALKDTGASQEMQEEWRKALATYRKALDLDPHAVFAKTGAKRAENLALLYEGMQLYLQDPSLLGKSAKMKHARALVEMAGANDAVSPKLQRTANMLRAETERYSQPVSVIIRSDGLTNVDVFHIGKLGTFEEQHLQLLPGQTSPHHQSQLMIAIV